MAAGHDAMRERCLYLIQLSHRAEREHTSLPMDTLVDMAIIRFALHKLTLPVAPDDIRECAQYLASMKLGDWCPSICANDLSELGRLALLGLDAEEQQKGKRA